MLTAKTVSIGAGPKEETPMTVREVIARLRKPGKAAIGVRVTAGFDGLTVAYVDVKKADLIRVLSKREPDELTNATTSHGILFID